MRAIHPPGQFDHNKIDPSLREGKYGRYNFDIGIMDKGTGSVRARYNGFVIDKDDLMNTAGGPNCLKIDITVNLANLDVAKVQSLDLMNKFLHKEAPEALDITISF